MMVNGKILSLDSTLMQWQEIIHHETGSDYNFCVNGPKFPKCKEFDQSPPKTLLHASNQLQSSRHLASLLTT